MQQEEVEDKEQEAEDMEEDMQEDKEEVVLRTVEEEVKDMEEEVKEERKVAENSISAKRNAYIEQHGQEDVNKIYHPEVSVQKQLIDDYKGKNKNFGTAHDTIVNNKTSIKPILDKIDENLWVDFIRGVFLLVVYCEVRSTALKINDGFIKFVLATQGYKIVNNIGRQISNDNVTFANLLQNLYGKELPKKIDIDIFREYFATKKETGEGSSTKKTLKFDLNSIPDD